MAALLGERADLRVECQSRIAQRPQVRLRAAGSWRSEKSKRHNERLPRRYAHGTIVQGPTFCCRNVALRYFALLRTPQSASADRAAVRRRSSPAVAIISWARGEDGLARALGILELRAITPRD